MALGIALADRCSCATATASRPPPVKCSMWSSAMSERSAVGLAAPRHRLGITRRQMRERLGWSDKQVRAATDRLVALEYLVASTGGRGRCRTYHLVAPIGPVGPRGEPVGPRMAQFAPGRANFDNRLHQRKVSELAQLARLEHAPMHSGAKRSECCRSRRWRIRRWTDAGDVVNVMGEAITRLPDLAGHPRLCQAH